MCFILYYECFIVAGLKKLEKPVTSIKNCCVEKCVKCIGFETVLPAFFIELTTPRKVSALVNVKKNALENGLTFENG